LENIAEYYKNSDGNGKTKKKILGCIFSEKLVLEKGKVATYNFTIPIQVKTVAIHPHLNITSST
jgi:hypothetical protein